MAWCRGRNWITRLLFVVGFGYILIQYWGGAEGGSILSPLNLGIHELGHLVFSPFGKFLGVLGGTLLQVFAPLFGMYNFFRQKDYFSIALCFGWLSTSLFDMARYVADARAMMLPLVTPFGVDTVEHDWNYLLGSMGILQWDLVLASLIRISASISMFVCLLGASWMIWQMYAQRKQ